MTNQNNEEQYYAKFSELMYLFMEYENSVPLFYKKYLRHLTSEEKTLVFEYLEKYGTAEALFLFRKWTERPESFDHHIHPNKYIKIHSLHISNIEEDDCNTNPVDVKNENI